MISIEGVKHDVIRVCSGADGRMLLHGSSRKKVAPTLHGGAFAENAVPWRV